MKYKFEADQLEYELQIFEDMEFHLLEKEMVLDQGDNSVMKQLENQESELNNLVDRIQVSQSSLLLVSLLSYRMLGIHDDVF